MVYVNGGQLATTKENTNPGPVKGDTSANGRLLEFDYIHFCQVSDIFPTSFYIWSVDQQAVRHSQRWKVQLIFRPPGIIGR